MAGTTRFLDRIEMTKEFDENVKPFMEEYGFELQDFGHPVLLRNNGTLRHHILKREFKKSSPVLMIKFSPDFIALHSESNSAPFFLDTKTSVTPVFFPSHINRIRQQARLDELRREDIFVVEREAWDVYNRFYPSDRVALIISCIYHPRLLLGEWVSNLRELYRLEDDHNPNAGGSGTPHVNLHMGEMRTLYDFLLEEFGVEVDSEDYEVMLDMAKQGELSKPRGTVNWTQFNNVVVELQRSCPWLETRNEPENWRRPPPRLI